MFSIKSFHFSEDMILTIFTWPLHFPFPVNILGNSWTCLATALWNICSKENEMFSLRNLQIEIEGGYLSWLRSCQFSASRGSRGLVKPKGMFIYQEFHITEQLKVDLIIWKHTRKKVLWIAGTMPMNFAPL